MSPLHAAHVAPDARTDSMPEPSLITHDAAGECFLDAFRRRVGRGPGKISVADLADAIDVQPRTVKAWRDGDTLPQWTALLRLCCHFGPAFTSELLTPAGLGGVEWVAIANPDPQGTVADLVEGTHNLCERLRDRVFCHRDCRESAPRLLEISRTLEAQARAMMAVGAA